MFYFSSMKQRIFIIIMALTLSFPLCAQDGLHISFLFNGQYRSRKDATEILLKGRKLKPYKLSLFRSITLSASATDVSSIERAVLADGSVAIDKEAAYNGSGKKLYYAFYQLTLKGNTRRYIFYRNNSLNPPKNRKATVTLIYMEGAADLNELKRNFSK